MVVVEDFLGFEEVTVDRKVLDGGAIVVQFEVFAVGRKALDEKGQLDYTLVNVPLVKVHYNLV